jgi:hypothetical protein
MKTKLLFVLLISVLATNVVAEDGFDGRPITNNLWSPTAFTLHQSEFSVGLGPIAFGVTDEIQVGTNILLFLLQVSNVNAKANIYTGDKLSLAAGVEYMHFDLSPLVSGDNDVTFNSIAPFAAISAVIDPRLSLHLSGRYSYFDSHADIDDYEAEYTTSGTMFMAGLEYSLSNRTKFMGDVGYDFSFSGYRFGGGVLFGWEKFRLKLGVNYYNPESASGGYTMPVIGLWWRFNG